MSRIKPRSITQPAKNAGKVFEKIGWWVAYAFVAIILCGGIYKVGSWAFSPSKNQQTTAVTTPAVPPQSKPVPTETWAPAKSAACPGAQKDQNGIVMPAALTRGETVDTSRCDTLWYLESGKVQFTYLSGQTKVVKAKEVVDSHEYGDPITKITSMASNTSLVLALCPKDTAPTDGTWDCRTVRNGQPGPLYEAGLEGAVNTDLALHLGVGSKIGYYHTN